MARGREYSIKIGLFTKGFTTKLNTMQAKLGVFGKSMKGFGSKLGANFSLPFAIGAAKGIHTMSKFQRSMNLARGTAELFGKTGEKTFQSLRKEALRLGKTTEFSSSQIADTIKTMLQAGATTPQIFKTLPSVLDLAVIAEMELNDAAKSTLGIMSVFNIKMKNSKGVIEALQKAASSGQTSIQDLAFAFESVSDVPKRAGLSMKDTAAIFAVFSKNMLKGTKAGRTLSNMLIQISDVSTNIEKQKILSGFGLKRLDMFNKEGALTRDGLFKMLSVMRKMDAQGKVTIPVMTKLFGKIGLKGFSALLKTTDEEFAKTISKVAKYDGTVKKFVKLLGSDMQGQFKSLLSAIEALVLAIGDSGVLKDIVKLTKKFTMFVRKMSTVDKTFLKTAFFAGSLLAALSPVLVSLGMMSIIIAKIPFAGMISGIFKMFTVFNPLTIAIMSSIAAVVLWRRNWESIKSWAKGYSIDFKGSLLQDFDTIKKALTDNTVYEGLKRWSAESQKTKMIASGYVKASEALKNTFRALKKGVTSAVRISKRVYTDFSKIIKGFFGDIERASNRVIEAFKKSSILTSIAKGVMSAFIKVKSWAVKTYGFFSKIGEELQGLFNIKIAKEGLKSVVSFFGDVSGHLNKLARMLPQAANKWFDFFGKIEKKHDVINRMKILWGRLDGVVTRTLKDAKKNIGLFKKAFGKELTVAMKKGFDVIVGDTSFKKWSTNAKLNLGLVWNEISTGISKPIKKLREDITNINFSKLLSKAKESFMSLSGAIKNGTTKEWNFFANSVTKNLTTDGMLGSLKNMEASFNSLGAAIKENLGVSWTITKKLFSSSIGVLQEKWSNFTKVLTDGKAFEAWKSNIVKNVSDLGGALGGFLKDSWNNFTGLFKTNIVKSWFTNANKVIAMFISSWNSAISKIKGIFSSAKAGISGWIDEISVMFKELTVEITREFFKLTKLPFVGPGLMRIIKSDPALELLFKIFSEKKKEVEVKVKIGRKKTPLETRSEGIRAAKARAAGKEETNVNFNFNGLPRGATVRERKEGRKRVFDIGSLDLGQMFATG